MIRREKKCKLHGKRQFNDMAECMAAWESRTPQQLIFGYQNGIFFMCLFVEWKWSDDQVKALSGYHLTEWKMNTSLKYKWVIKIKIKYIFIVAIKSSKNPMDLKWPLGKVVNQENERLVYPFTKYADKWVCVCVLPRFIYDAAMQRSHTNYWPNDLHQTRSRDVLSLCNGHTKNIHLFISRRNIFNHTIESLPLSFCPLRFRVSRCLLKHVWPILSSYRYKTTCCLFIDIELKCKQNPITTNFKESMRFSFFSLRRKKVTHNTTQ